MILSAVASSMPGTLASCSRVAVLRSTFELDEWCDDLLLDFDDALADGVEPIDCADMPDAGAADCADAAGVDCVEAAAWAGFEASLGVEGEEPCAAASSGSASIPATIEAKTRFLRFMW